MFFRELELGKIKGALLRMGNSMRELDRKDSIKRERSDYDAFQTDKEVALALGQATELKALSPALFNRISRHGFEIANHILTTHLPETFPASYAWPDR